MVFPGRDGPSQSSLLFSRSPETTVTYADPLSSGSSDTDTLFLAVLLAAAILSLTLSTSRDVCRFLLTTALYTVLKGLASLSFRILDPSRPHRGEPFFHLAMKESPSSSSAWTPMRMSCRMASVGAAHRKMFPTQDRSPKMVTRTRK